MKTITKNIFKACAILLFAAGAAMPASAAEPAAKQPLAYPGGQLIEVGDTIRIPKDQLRYLTGERMSTWVYKKTHVVQQVGGRRYPHGVLLKGIYSWVYPYQIVPVNPKAPKTDSITLVACGEYYWDATDMTYTEGGEYVFTGKAANGCDSTVILFLTVNDIPNTVINKTSCGEFYWDLTQETYEKSGSYNYTTTAANGCDSIVTLNLTVRKPTEKTTKIEIRPRQLPYEWNGIVMNNIGDTSRVAGKDNYGCDIIEQLNLSFKPQKRWGKPITPIVPGWVPNLPYHIDRISGGVRGGFASNLAGQKLPLGAGAALDFSLAHYWVAGENKTAYGLKTGLSLGYVYTTQSLANYMHQSSFNASAVLDYTVAVDHVAQTTHQLQLELPIMFSMQTPGGFFLNAGPKFILPVMSKYHQTLTNPAIEVTGFEELPVGFGILNEVVTGKVPEDMLNKTANFVENGSACKLFSVALGAELGYNIKLKKYGQSIDLGVFADYSVINAYKPQASGQLISIVPPTNNSAALVNVHSLSNAYADKFGYMNVGLKVTFNFDSMYYFN
jgi:hypothetical protein